MGSLLTNKKGGESVSFGGKLKDKDTKTDDL